MSDNHSINHKVASVILAGGEGTRLQPLTQSRCKPAVSFAGRYRLIDIPISNSLNSNIKRIYVISQYLAAGLHRHILETYPEATVAPGKIEFSPLKYRWPKMKATRGLQTLSEKISHFYCNHPQTIFSSYQGTSSIIWTSLPSLNLQ